jgi:hypothetical protein
VGCAAKIAEVNVVRRERLQELHGGEHGGEHRKVFEIVRAVRRRRRMFGPKGSGDRVSRPTVEEMMIAERRAESPLLPTRIIVRSRRKSR